MKSFREMTEADVTAHNARVADEEAAAKGLPAPQIDAGGPLASNPHDVADAHSGSDVEPPDAFLGPEKLLHRDLIADLNRRGAHVVHARCDQASTIEAGLPDVHALFTSPKDGVTRACAVELKRSGGKLSRKQIEVIAEMRRKKIPILVAWTLRDAINFTKEKLHL